MLKTTLRDLHAHLLRVRDLKDAADEARRRRQRLVAKIASAQKALDEHQEKLKHLKVAIHEKEVSIKANQELIAKYRKQKMAATEQKQLDALTHQIDNAIQENNVYEEQALLELERVEQEATRTAGLQDAVAAAQAALARCDSEAGAEEQERTRQLAQAEEQVRTTEAALDADIRKAYQRIAVQLGADCLAPCTRRSCTGCNTEVTGQQYNDLISGRFVTCKACSRLLYDPN